MANIICSSSGSSVISKTSSAHAGHPTYIYPIHFPRRGCHVKFGNSLSAASSATYVGAGSAHSQTCPTQNSCQRILCHVHLYLGRSKKLFVE